MKEWRQISIAREFRKLSQSDLAKQIDGLSQPNLSKYEKGLGGLSEEIVFRIMKTLEFPEGFINERIHYSIENAHFRKRKSITVKNVKYLESLIKLVAFTVDKFSDSLEWPEFKLTPLEIEDGFTPEDVALHNRSLLGLKPSMPVKNICELLESNGVIIIELGIGLEKFDGVSIISDSGIPLIIINKYFTNDRKRFTIAHELGHILLHLYGNPAISSYRDKEKEANSFASEFLMPIEGIYDSLVNLKLSSLTPLKSNWLTSMASIVHKAYSIGAIDKKRYTHLNIEMSRRGMKKNEGFSVFIDRPSLLKEAYKLFKDSLDYSISDFNKGFQLPRDFILNLFGDNSNSLRLKVV